VSNVTDPSIIKVGATYYLFSSGPGIQVRESADLKNWAALGSVFPTIPAWALTLIPNASSIWAPDISLWNGQYHLYYAVSTFGSQRSVIGLATNTTLDPRAAGYHWVDRGAVIQSQPGRDNFNAIDPNLAADGAGNFWLAFGSQWSGIKLLRLSPTTGLPSQAAQPIALAARPGAKQIEAPFVFRQGSYFYLFVSFDRCCEGSASTYKLMVGRSSTVNGPYLDHSGKPMTRGGGTLVLAGSGRFRGPGSSAVITTGTGTDLVYQAYDAWNGGIPTLQVRPLAWTDDGWPVVAGDPLS
jgi:arabinan endo-1,5-alpha-L-arabinosidase